MENLTEAVREAKRQYMREWRKKNPERVKENNRRYWERKAKQLQENRGENNAKANGWLFCPLSVNPVGQQNQRISARVHSHRV